LIPNHHRGDRESDSSLPFTSYHRMWHTPRTSIIERQRPLSDCLKCTIIYQAFQMCKMYEIDINL
jgi:hypothetical protein